jgi:uncharacterized protein YndB with AHSA1/START domain
MTNNAKRQKLVVTRIFNAPLHEVWRAWTEAEMVKQWWGPNGFTCPVANMDFHEGGTSFVCMRAPKEMGGMDMYNTWMYTTIEPYKKFECILKFADKDGNQISPSAAGIPEGVPDEVRNVNEFEDLGDGRTKVTITEEGYTTAEAVNMSKMGLEQCLDKMEKALKGG